MNEVLTHLSSRQQETVCYIESLLLILAGAGSGKTRVLTHKAIGEMRTQIDSLVCSKAELRRIRDRAAESEELGL